MREKRGWEVEGEKDTTGKIGKREDEGCIYISGSSLGYSSVHGNEDKHRRREREEKRKGGRRHRGGAGGGYAVIVDTGRGLLLASSAAALLSERRWIEDCSAALNVRISAFFVLPWRVAQVGGYCGR